MPPVDKGYRNIYCLLPDWNLRTSYYIADAFPFGFEPRWEWHKDALPGNGSIVLRSWEWPHMRLEL